MADDKTIPPRVMELAAQIGDTPLAWKEHEDGSIVIVFGSKGKQTFVPEKPAAKTTEEPAPEAQAKKSKKKGE